MILVSLWLKGLCSLIYQPTLSHHFSFTFHCTFVHLDFTVLIKTFISRAVIFRRLSLSITVMYLWSFFESLMSLESFLQPCCGNTTNQRLNMAHYWSLVGYRWLRVEDDRVKERQRASWEVDLARDESGDECVCVGDMHGNITFCVDSSQADCVRVNNILQKIISFSFFLGWIRLVFSHMDNVCVFVLWVIVNWHFLTVCVNSMLKHIFKNLLVVKSAIMTNPWVVITCLKQICDVNTLCCFFSVFSSPHFSIFL